MGLFWGHILSKHHDASDDIEFSDDRMSILQLFMNSDIRALKLDIVLEQCLFIVFFGNLLCEGFTILNTRFGLQIGTENMGTMF